jgi:hypothetical protein
MADYYSTVTSYGCIPCSFENYQKFLGLLLQEKQRLLNEDIENHLEAELISEGLFLASEFYDDDTFTTEICLEIGRLLDVSGMEYMQFGFSQTASSLFVNSNGGGEFRVYRCGALVWPKMVWPG